GHPHATPGRRIEEPAVGEAGDAERRADDSRQESGEHGVAEHATRGFEGAATSCVAVDQPTADDAFERVADGDAERREGEPGRAEIGADGADEDPGPDPWTEEDAGGEGDPGGRPDHAGARIDRGEREPDLA